MSLFQMSIQKRLTILVGTCLLLVVGSLTYTSRFMAGTTGEMISERSAQVLEDASMRRLNAEASAQSLNLQNYFLAAFKEGEGLARQASDTKNIIEANKISSEALRRELIKLIDSKLSTNKELLSVYLTFEPNILGDDDRSFINRSDLGSNEQGRFSYYIARDGEKFTSVVTPESIIKDDTPGLDGTPFRTWYDCPIKTAKPCLLSPYFDDGSGKKTLITSVVIPIMADGRVIGVAGMDISLEKLQAFVGTAASSIYEGAGSITILTPSGIIAGDSHKPESLGTVINNDSSSNSAHSSSAYSATQLISDSQADFMSVVLPISPIPDSLPWEVMIRVPKSTVLAPVAALQSELSEKASSNFTIEMGVGVVAAVLGLVVVWLTARGVTVPMLRVANALKGIATGGGDLTQRVGYQRNDELGQLSNWFNKILDVLQPLVKDIQGLATQANLTALRSASLSTELDSNMQKQFLE